MKTCVYQLVLLLTIWFGCARAPHQETDEAPRIRNLRLESGEQVPGQHLLLSAEISDPDGDSLTVEWQANVGSFLAQYEDSARWESPDSSAFVRVIVLAVDPAGNQASDTLRFWVNNQPPIFQRLGVSSRTVLNGNTITLNGMAVDPDSHAVELRWSTPWGNLSAAVGDTVRWTVPDSTMHAWVAVAAVDSYGASRHDTVRVNVYTEVGCAWVINQGRQEVVKLSSIGDELLRLDGFQDLQDLDVDPENRRLWVVEGDPPTLHSFDLRGNRLFQVTDRLARPIRLRSWFRTGSVLVLDADSAQVIELNLYGDRVMRRVGGLTRPNSLDLDQRTGALWICDEGSNHLFHVSDGYEGSIPDVWSSPHVIRRDGYQFPVDISVEDSTGACWLVDKEAGMLVRYEANGQDSLIVSGFQNPVAVAATWSEGLCWVLDRGLDGEVLRYFFDQEQVALNGLLFPKDLAFNRIDSHVWVLDTERNRILRIRPDGLVAGVWTDFDFPTRIVINGGY
jgi:hypothetical protein